MWPYRACQLYLKLDLNEVTADSKSVFFNFWVWVVKFQVTFSIKIFVNYFIAFRPYINKRKYYMQLLYAFVIYKYFWNSFSETSNKNTNYLSTQNQTKIGLPPIPTLNRVPTTVRLSLQQQVFLKIYDGIEAGMFTFFKNRVRWLVDRLLAMCVRLLHLPTHLFCWRKK